MDQQKLIDGIHAGLLDMLAAENFFLGKGTDDTRTLAVRLEAITRGQSLPGQYDGELTRRAALLVSIVDQGIKGRAQKIGRILQTFERCLRAARGAVGDE